MNPPNDDSSTIGAAEDLLGLSQGRQVSITWENDPAPQANHIAQQVLPSPNGQSQHIVRQLTTNIDAFSPPQELVGQTVIPQDPATLIPEFDPRPMSTMGGSMAAPELSSYLQNVMDFAPAFNFGPMGSLSGTCTPRVPFGLDTNLELDDIDFNSLFTYSTNIPFDHALQSPESLQQGSEKGTQKDRDLERRAQLGSDAYRKSVWRFRPVTSDRGGADHQHLSLPIVETDKDSPESRIDLSWRTTSETLDQSSRDKLFAMVLGTIKAPNLTRVASSFPSLELLDSLLQFYLTSSHCRADTWFHIPSIRPKTGMREELLGAMIAAGAFLTPDDSLRKFGLAIQEVVRLAIPPRWEENNTTIRDLELLQAFLLQLELSLWSGHSRKIEIAESFLQPITTMIRRGGQFRKSVYRPIRPTEADHGEELELKWKAWVEQESYKRLVFKLHSHDAQSSLALSVSPLISYAELTLPFPEAKALWLAPDAEAWKATYLELSPMPDNLPGIADCLSEWDPLITHREHIDIPESALAVLYATWGLIWEFRQFSSTLKTQTLLTNSRREELVRQLTHHRLSVSELATNRPIISLVLEAELMHLHAPFTDLQMFAGLEGKEEALQSYTSLRDWVKTSSARSAVWHAGQILRIAKTVSPNILRNFHAIIFYHASLALFVYGVLTTNSTTSADSARLMASPVWLDGPDSSEVQRFIASARGIPGVRGGHNAEAPPLTAPLDDPSAVMDIIVDMLKQNFVMTLGPLPPLVENLCQLMRGLQLAARAQNT